MIPLYWLAGTILVLIAASNVPLRRLLPIHRELSSASPIVRQICTVHHVYIGGILLGMGLLCLFFAPDLAGGSALATFLNAGFAVFWGGRVLLQLFYYDRAVRRANRAWDVLFTLAFFSLAAIFTAAAAGGLR